jgi:hypothetical protein
MATAMTRALSKATGLLPAGRLDHRVNSGRGTPGVPASRVPVALWHGRLGQQVASLEIGRRVDRAEDGEACR